MGTTINYDKHCRVPFGTYVQFHKQHNNSMVSHTSGAIALRPSGNAQGSYYFLNLHSGKRIIRNNWTVLLMPNEVINTIHQLAAACKKYKGIAFMDKDGNIINDANDDGEGNIEITGVEDSMYSTDNMETGDNMETTGVEDINDGITNDDINKDINEEVNNNMSNYNNPNTDNNGNYNNPNTDNNDNINVADDDDDISIEGELPNDTW